MNLFRGGSRMTLFASRGVKIDSNSEPHYADSRRGIEKPEATQESCLKFLLWHLWVSKWVAHSLKTNSKQVVQYRNCQHVHLPTMVCLFLCLFVCFSVLQMGQASGYSWLILLKQTMWMMSSARITLGVTLDPMRVQYTIYCIYIYNVYRLPITI